METWTENGGTITDSPGTMTGDCFLVNPDTGDTNISVIDLGEGYAQFQYQKSANPSGSDYIFRTGFSSCQMIQRSTGAGGWLSLENSGGATVSSSALSNNTNYTIDVHWVKGTGSNAVCEFRVDGGTAISSTNGTWTANRTTWMIEGISGITLRFDEIKLCTEGWIVDGACDVAPPALSDAAVFTGPWPGHSQVVHFEDDDAQN